MKKIIFFLLAVVFIFSANAQQWVNFSSSEPKVPKMNLLTSNAQTVSFEITIPGVYTKDTVVNGVTFTRLTLPGGSIANSAGSPEIPVFNYKVAVPVCTAIFNTADFLATRCHIKEKNWQPAIDWYENRIENPPSYQDSVFAVIDLGDIHLMMEADTISGAKSGRAYYRLANIRPRSKREYETSKATLLATLPQIKSQKPQTPYLTPQTDKKGALGQNIPNPATGITTINFEIYTEGAVEIVIYNISGQLVKSLPQGNLTEGNYQTKISLVGMPVGMYHYALFVNGERTDAKKMIVN
ncbi:MAG: T9SS type A sorting domain-containing protein [Bacteroidetes bacterium]|nr:T9SS type A sorting domain-containing protein [Bacteroidota bacterium]MCL2303049.1 T9SS type A sorting domain-containing protein [Lentimicrobiaceae bacterium]